MIGLVFGKNRGYFEIDKVYDGKPYKSRFIQLEQIQDDGQIRIEKINVPNKPEIINQIQSIEINGNAELYVKFGVYNGFLTKKVVGV